mmetsp:Transcript_71427/g.206810  ORF Transcript_71427/g.206810 Transcript_71427/m.206810 type:complete len:83 (+) Transcript_71427:459-707(+)
MVSLKGLFVSSRESKLTKISAMGEASAQLSKMVQKLTPTSSSEQMVCGRKCENACMNWEKAQEGMQHLVLPVGHLTMPKPEN